MRLRPPRSPRQRLRSPVVFRRISLALQRTAMHDQTPFVCPEPVGARPSIIHGSRRCVERDIRYVCVRFGALSDNPGLLRRRPAAPTPAPRYQRHPLISPAFMHGFKHGMIHRPTLLTAKSPEEDRALLKSFRGGPLAPLTSYLRSRINALPRQCRHFPLQVFEDLRSADPPL